MFTRGCVPVFLLEMSDQRIRELFKTKDAQEWEDLVAAAGSEGAVCRTSAEWFAHPHAHASGAVIEVEDPRFGRMLQPGINPRLRGTSGTVRRHAPVCSHSANSEMSNALQCARSARRLRPWSIPTTSLDSLLN